MRTRSPEVLIHELTFQVLVLLRTAIAWRSVSFRVLLKAGNRSSEETPDDLSESVCGNYRSPVEELVPRQRKRRARTRQSAGCSLPCCRLMEAWKGCDCVADAMEVTSA